MIIVPATNFMKPEFLKIDAQEVMEVSIKENGEPLVDIIEAHPDIFVDETRAYAQKTSKSISFLRKGVAERLSSAAEHLPGGVRFKIIEGHRPVEVQRKIFDKQMKKFREQHPDWNESRLLQETSTFVAPPDDTPPHSTGGAIDLTLMKSSGEELDMGTDLNEGYSGSCFMDAEDISREARKNRSILIEVMEKARFVNYPAEWWHWSYGDRYWAYLSKEQFAYYGSV